MQHKHIHELCPKIQEVLQRLNTEANLLKGLYIKYMSVCNKRHIYRSHNETGNRQRDNNRHGCRPLRTTHTTHLRHTGLGQMHYLNFCYGRFSPHSSRFHFNSIMSYKLTFLMLMTYKFNSQQSAIHPPPSTAVYLLFIRRSSFSHIVTTAKWNISNEKHVVKKGTTYLSFAVFKISLSAMYVLTTASMASTMYNPLQKQY